ncbi:hypothetical protein QQF64_024239 [Cirrhinus molitorella]|uniref:Uncharacterized protein n=1 Tax=Cirrhinus molitorella TaxID=172907 RepID=A0ABR3NLL1_9TELE
MDESDCVDASLATHDYERDFSNPLLATPSKSPPGRKKRDSNEVSLAEIFNAIQSLNSKQDSVIQKITHIESSIEVTTVAVNSLSDTVNRLLSDVASHGEKIADIDSHNKLWPLVQAARKEGKKASFSGPFAVINNKRNAANSAQYP